MPNIEMKIGRFVYNCQHKAHGSSIFPPSVVPCEQNKKD